MFQKSEYLDWRSMPMTQALYEDIRSQAEGLAAEIINRQDENPKRDSFCKGNLSMADQVLRWRPDFVPEPTLDEDGNLVDGTVTTHED